MTEPELQQAMDKGKVNILPPETPNTPETSVEPFDEKIPVIELMRRPRRALSAPPTFVPKSFAESIQFVDNGVAKSVYAYVNKNWIQLSSGGGAKTATIVVGPSSNSDSTGYDYVTDGTDDDVQIQAAIDALPTNGGRIILREGQYSCTNTINIDKNGVTLQGQGKGTIVKVAAASSLNYLFYLGNNTPSANTIIRDIYFDGNKANVGYLSGIVLNAANENVEILGCYFVDSLGNCIENLGTILVDGCYFLNWLRQGSNKWAIATGGYEVIQNCYFSTDDINGAKYVGDRGTPIFTNNLVFVPDDYSTNAAFDTLYICNDNMFFVGTGFQQVLISIPHTCNNNYFDFGSGADPASYAILLGDTVVGNYFEGYGPGVAIKADTRTTISGNTIFGTQGHAIYCSESNVSITNNIIHDAGQAADDTYSGIFLTGALRCVINGNVIVGGTTPKKLKYGIREDIGTEDKNIISSNVVNNININTPISIQGANTINANNITT